MGEFKELIVEILGWENNKLLRTLKDFTIRPGESIWAFCNGNRKIYFHPMAYMFGVVGLIVLFNTYFEPPFKKINEQKMELAHLEKINSFEPESDRYKIEIKAYNLQKNVQRILSHPNMYYFYQLLITFFHLIVFRKMNVGLKNNVWFTTYVFTHASLLVFILTPLLFFISDFKFLMLVSLLMSLIMFLYRAWASKQFFKISWGRSILKVFLIYFLLLFIPFLIGVISTLAYFIFS